MTRASIARVAFQGDLGAYGEEAIVQRWCGKAMPVPRQSFGDVVTALATALAEYAVVPVWNTVVGDVDPGLEAVRAALALPSRPVMREHIEVRIRHQLLAPHGTRLEDVVEAASHPVALAQCGAFFERHPHIEPRAAYDTAGAARALARSRRPRSAAIAGPLAAARYGLAVLASDIQDIAHTVTRFVVLHHPSHVSPGANGATGSAAHV
jgi:prephenate dehydratase